MYTSGASSRTPQIGLERRNLRSVFIEVLSPLIKRSRPEAGGMTLTSVALQHGAVASRKFSSQTQLPPSTRKATHQVSLRQRCCMDSVALPRPLLLWTEVVVREVSFLSPAVPPPVAESPRASDESAAVLLSLPAAAIFSPCDGGHWPRSWLELLPTAPLPEDEGWGLSPAPGRL